MSSGGQEQTSRPPSNGQGVNPSGPVRLNQETAQYFQQLLNSTAHIRFAQQQQGPEQPSTPFLLPPQVVSNDVVRFLDGAQAQIDQMRRIHSQSIANPGSQMQLQSNHYNHTEAALRPPYSNGVTEQARIVPQAAQLHQPLQLPQHLQNPQAPRVLYHPQLTSPHISPAPNSSSQSQSQSISNLPRPSFPRPFRRYVPDLHPSQPPSSKMLTRERDGVNGQKHSISQQSGFAPQPYLPPSTIQYATNNIVHNTHQLASNTHQNAGYGESSLSPALAAPSVTMPQYAPNHASGQNLQLGPPDPGLLKPTQLNYAATNDFRSGQAGFQPHRTQSSGFSPLPPYGLSQAAGEITTNRHHTQEPAIRWRLPQASAATEGQASNEIQPGINLTSPSIAPDDASRPSGAVHEVRQPHAVMELPRHAHVKFTAPFLGAPPPGTFPVDFSTPTLILEPGLPSSTTSTVKLSSVSRETVARDLLHALARDDLIDKLDHIPNIQRQKGPGGGRDMPGAVHKQKLAIMMEGEPSLVHASHISPGVQRDASVNAPVGSAPAESTTTETSIIGLPNPLQVLPLAVKHSESAVQPSSPPALGANSDVDPPRVRKRKRSEEEPRAIASISAGTYNIGSPVLTSQSIVRPIKFPARQSPSEPHRLAIVRDGQMEVGHGRMNLNTSSRGQDTVKPSEERPTTRCSPTNVPLTVQSSSPRNPSDKLLQGKEGSAVETLGELNAEVVLENTATPPPVSSNSSSPPVRGSRIPLFLPSDDEDEFDVTHPKPSNASSHLRANDSELLPDIATLSQSDHIESRSPLPEHETSAPMALIPLQLLPLHDLSAPVSRESSSAGAEIRERMWNGNSTLTNSLSASKHPETRAPPSYHPSLKLRPYVDIVIRTHSNRGLSKNRPSLSDNETDHRNLKQLMTPFACQWVSCNALLASMEKLERHVIVVHSQDPSCRWGDCGRERTSMNASLLQHIAERHLSGLSLWSYQGFGTNRVRKHIGRAREDRTEKFPADSMPGQSSGTLKPLPSRAPTFELMPDYIIWPAVIGNRRAARLRKWTSASTSALRSSVTARRPRLITESRRHSDSSEGGERPAVGKAWKDLRSVIDTTDCEQPSYAGPRVLLEDPANGDDSYSPRSAPPEPVDATDLAASDVPQASAFNEDDLQTMENAERLRIYSLTYGMSNNYQNLEEKFPNAERSLTNRRDE